MNTALLSQRVGLLSGVAPKSSSIRSRVSRLTVSAGADRQLWLPGSTPPKHLDGSLAGDYGFDPLLLGADPKALKWYVQAELIHGRFAMTAVAGIILPGLLKSIGVLNLPEWYDAGYVAQKNSFAPFGVLLAVQLILFGFVEGKRFVDFQKPGSQAEPGSFFGLEGGFKGKENGYPGGFFDPLNYAEGPAYKENKTKEIKNGRLAMLAFLGFAAQYAATGKGPLENLGDHLKSPTASNFTTNGISLPFNIG